MNQQRRRGCVAADFFNDAITRRDKLVIIFNDIFTKISLSLNPSPKERDFAACERSNESLNLCRLFPLFSGRGGQGVRSG